MRCLKDIKKNTPGVYKIENIKNHTVYIGSSGNIYERFLQHRSSLKNKKHRNKLLQEDYNKYGEEYFTFEVVQYTSQYRDLEYAIMNQYEKLYNSRRDLSVEFNPTVSAKEFNELQLKYNKLQSQSTNYKKGYEEGFIEAKKIFSKQLDKSLRQWLKYHWRWLHKGKEDEFLSDYEDVLDGDDSHILKENEVVYL